MNLIGDIFTFSELKAARILNIEDPHKAGNVIIELAENIKSERIVVLM